MNSWINSLVGGSMPVLHYSRERERRIAITLFLATGFALRRSLEYR
jgi:hypothetical protein